MPENQEILVPAAGGLNTDDDLLFIANTDGRLRQNVVSSDDSKLNVLTNLKWKTIKDNYGTFNYPAGNKQVVGIV